MTQTGIANKPPSPLPTSSPPRPPLCPLSPTQEKETKKKKKQAKLFVAGKGGAKKEPRKLHYQLKSIQDELYAVLQKKKLRELFGHNNHVWLNGVRMFLKQHLLKSKIYVTMSLTQILEREKQIFMQVYNSMVNIKDKIDYLYKRSLVGLLLKLIYEDTVISESLSNFLKLTTDSRILMNLYRAASHDQTLNNPHNSSDPEPRRQKKDGNGKDAMELRMKEVIRLYPEYQFVYNAFFNRDCQTVIDRNLWMARIRNSEKVFRCYQDSCSGCAERLEMFWNEHMASLVLIYALSIRSTTRTFSVPKKVPEKDVVVQEAETKTNTTFRKKIPTTTTFAAVLKFGGGQVENKKKDPEAKTPTNHLPESSSSPSRPPETGGYTYGVQENDDENIEILDVLVVDKATVLSHFVYIQEYLFLHSTTSTEDNKGKKGSHRESLKPIFIGFLPTSKDTSSKKAIELCHCRLYHQNDKKFTDFYYPSSEIVKLGKRWRDMYLWFLESRYKGISIWKNLMDALTLTKTATGKDEDNEKENKQRDHKKINNHHLTEEEKREFTFKGLKFLFSHLTHKDVSDHCPSFHHLYTAYKKTISNGVRREKEPIE